jgi:flagellar protein FlaG
MIMDIKSVGITAPVSTAQAGNIAATGMSIPLPQRKAVAASVDPTAAVQQPDPIATSEQLNRALESINKTMQSLSADLEFIVDGDTGRTIVRVTDKATGELLRQMPSKEALEIAQALDKVQGLLIRQKA